MIAYRYKSWFDEPSMQKDYIITDGTVVPNSGSLEYSKYTVRITNNEIADDITIKQYLCSNKQLVYGSCEASCLTMTIYAYVKSLKNMVLNVYMYLDGKPETLIQIGVFKVNSDKYNDGRDTRTIEAYDWLGFYDNTDVSDWYDSVFEENSELTLFEFRAKFFEHIGIVPLATSLPNDNMPVRHVIDTSNGGLKAMDVLMNICQINGAFGHINNNGYFVFKYLDSDVDKILYPSESLFPEDSMEDPEDNLYPQDPYENMVTLVTGDYYTINWESFMAASVQVVCLADEDTAIAYSYPEDTEGNTLLINDNMFVYGLSYEEMVPVAENLFDKVKNRYYVPIEMEAPGRPFIEVGDPIFISTPDGGGIYSYVLERSLEGASLLTDTIESQGREEFENDDNGSSRETRKTNGKIMKLKKEIDEVSLELSEELDDTKEGSFAKITKDAIEFEVKRAKAEEDELSAKIKLNADNILLKVTKGDVINQINLDTSGIKINGSKITLEGQITANRNFQIDLNGTMTCNNAEIDSGRLYSCIIEDYIMLTSSSAFYLDSTKLDADVDVVSIEGITITLEGGASTFIKGGSSSITLDYSTSDSIRLNSGNIYLTSGNVYLPSSSNSIYRGTNQPLEWHNVKTTDGYTLKVLGYYVT